MLSFIAPNDPHLSLTFSKAQYRQKWLRKDKKAIHALTEAQRKHHKYASSNVLIVPYAPERVHS